MQGKRRWRLGEYTYLTQALPALKKGKHKEGLMSFDPATAVLDLVKTLIAGFPPLFSRPHTIYFSKNRRFIWVG